MPQPRGWQTRGRRSWRPAARGFGVIAALLTAGESGGGADLTEALAYAYQNNPQLLAQRASLRATDEEVPQALSGLAADRHREHPGRVQPRRSDRDQRADRQPKRRSTRALKAARWRFRRPSRSIAAAAPKRQTRQAINTVQAARAQTLSVETDVFHAVVTAFLDVVRDQNLLEVARNNEQVLRRQLEATRDRFRVGEVTRTDVAQAEAALAQAIAQRITAEGNLEISRSLYTRAVGHPPQRLVMPRRAPGPAGDAGRGAGACRDQQFQRDFGDVYRSRRARQCRFRPRPAAAAGFDRRQHRAQHCAVGQPVQCAHRHRLGGRPGDHAALRSGQCLCADAAGGADRRATAQPGR